MGERELALGMARYAVNAARPSHAPKAFDAARR
jgi:hypothetical protein